MTDAERDQLRAEVIKQAVILTFGVVTLILYTVGQRRMGEPDWWDTTVERWKIRLGFKRYRRDEEAEMMRQVQREISLMEHGES